MLEASSRPECWEVTFHRVSFASAGVPTSVSWCLNASDGVAFVSQRGPLYIWVYGGPEPGVTVHKEAHSFLSDICLFRWHPNKKGKLVFGHTDGSLSIFQPGLDTFFCLKLNNTKHTQSASSARTFINTHFLSSLGSKSQKHVLRPESLEGTDEEDPVSALEWDLLSADYLLGSSSKCRHLFMCASQKFGRTFSCSLNFSISTTVSAAD